MRAWRHGHHICGACVCASGNIFELHGRHHAACARRVAELAAYGAVCAGAQTNAHRIIGARGTHERTAAATYRRVSTPPHVVHAAHHIVFCQFYSMLQPLNFIAPHHSLSLHRTLGCGSVRVYAVACRFARRTCWFALRMRAPPALHVLPLMAGGDRTNGAAATRAPRSGDDASRLKTRVRLDGSSRLKTRGHGCCNVA
jgi:hypothetical protein